MLRVIVATGAFVLACGAAYAGTYGPPPDIPGWKEVPLGAYACIVRRTVGIQGDRAVGQRYAGAIELAEDKRTFTLTLTEIERDSAFTKYCANAKPRSNSPSTAVPSGMPYSSDLDYWYYCKASYELQLGPSKVTSHMRGDNRSTFMDHGQWKSFHFGRDWFLFQRDDSAGNFYIEEGECQAM